MNATQMNAQRALDELPAGRGPTQKRLREMRDFYRTATKWTQKLIDDMRSQDGRATRNKQ